MSDLDDKYRDEGWGIVSERALSIRPSDTESQAREVARWAWAEIERLRDALQWMVDHDESGPDDHYHLDGLERAKAALKRTQFEAAE